jgi:hypothetical protein
MLPVRARGADSVGRPLPPASGLLLGAARHDAIRLVG